MSIDFTKYDPELAFYRRANWERSFALWPRRCAISDKLIWLTFGYEGTAMWTGPGEPAYEYKWHDSDEHLMYLMKK